MQVNCKVILTMLAAATCWAGEIAGVVLDPAGRGAGRVKVELQPPGAYALTDADGQFRFPRLTAAEYTVTATSTQFEAAEPVKATVSGEGVAEVRIQFAKVVSTRVQLDVIGDVPEVALREIPGSASLITREEVAIRRPVDANEMLRSVPGVHVREDSGPVGMRLNVGIRGLNPDRSRSLLVLEDGLPLSLAPYGEPEMYYSPPIDRMSRVELLKGSGSILYGPQTIGGVMNFVTPDPPSKHQGTLDLTGGQYGFFTGQASYGGSRDSTGWYINVLRKQGDGWRDLYFGINDLTAKLNTAISDRQKLGFKLNLYDEGSNSTYLGLTDAQFRADPSINVVPDDLLKVRRQAGSILHQAVLSPNALLSTSAFAYTTTRNWRRQDFDRARVAGVTYLAIAGDPSVPQGAVYLRNSSGNNNREFDVAGVESRLGWEHRIRGIRNRLDAGVRYVYEQHRDRRIDGSTHTALSGVIREDEIRYGDGWSGFLQNRIFVSHRLSVTPGIRLEHYSYERNILRQPVAGVPADVSIRRGDRVVKPIPGIGAAYQAAGGVTLFAGLHRGFAPPRVKDAITRAGTSLLLDAELSWNYEAGARLQLSSGLRGEVTWFRTDFENQIIPAALSGGAATTLVNGGETLHQGVEASVSADWGRASGRAAGFFSEVRHTALTTARFASGTRLGNRLPYAPRHNFALVNGYRHRKGFNIAVDGTRVDEQFADDFQTRPGAANGTVGLIPSYWVWNVSAGHEINRERVVIQPFVSTKNFADARYISSRAPQGIQPGMFRQVTAGIKFRFF